MLQWNELWAAWENSLVMTGQLILVISMENTAIKELLSIDVVFYYFKA